MGTYYSQCSMWQLAFSHWYSMFVSYRQRRHLRTAVGKIRSVLPANCVTGTCMSYGVPGKDMPAWAAMTDCKILASSKDAQNTKHVEIVFWVRSQQSSPPSARTLCTLSESHLLISKVLGFLPPHIKNAVPFVVTYKFCMPSLLQKRSNGSHQVFFSFPFFFYYSSREVSRHRDH